MNCFAHGYRFLDQPYKLVGSALPDWLALIDRKVRVRERRASKLSDDASRKVAETAAGIVQHHRDDAWFHSNPHFVQLNLSLSIELREWIGPEAGFRPHFAAHVFIEMLLDAWLARNRESLDKYYRQVAKVDVELIEKTVNRIAEIKTQKIAAFIPLFIQERYLYDYLQDEGLLYRMNRILKRVKLEPLPERVLDWLPGVRTQVYDRGEQLLDRILKDDNSETTDISSEKK